MLKIDNNNVKINNKIKNQYEFFYKNDKPSNIKITINDNGNLQIIFELIHFNYLEIETKHKKIIKNDNYDSLIFNSEMDKDDYININFTLSINSKLILKSVKFNNNNERFNIQYDNIFIINLKENIDRREKISKEFKKFNIKNYEFLEAIDGKTVSNYKEVKHKIKTRGHYGCLLSHKKAIQLSINRKYKNVLIFEDDIELTEYFFDILKNIKVPKYNMLYFGGLTDGIKLFMNNFSYIKDYNVMGAYGYSVNESLYSTIIDLIENKVNCIDMIYVEHLQKRDDIILLNDIILTNEDTTNTSDKGNIFYTNLDKIKIKYDIDNKNISFLNDKDNIEHCYILGESNDLLDYFIPEKFYIHNLNQLRKIKDDYKLIITNLFNINNISINDIIRYEYYIIITDYYWINDELLLDKKDKSIPWIFNNDRNDIKINENIITLFKKAKTIIFLSEHSLKIYEKHFKNMNFLLLEPPKIDKIEYYTNPDNIKLGIIKTDYFFNETEVENIINKYYSHRNIQIIYINNEFYIKNFKDFLIENQINSIIYLPLYPVCYNPNIEIINSLNIQILSY